MQKALLIKDSPYFASALEGPFIEGQTQTIDLGDDISAGDFGTYVDVLFHSYCNAKYIFKPTRRAPGGTNFSESLCLWRLSNRFLNSKLIAIADKALAKDLNGYTVEYWEEIYKSRSWSNESLLGLVLAFQKGDAYCREFHIPQKDKLVNAVANMPSTLFIQMYDRMREDFRKVVVTRLLQRMGDHTLQRPVSVAEANDLFETDSTA